MNTETGQKSNEKKETKLNSESGNRTPGYPVRIMQMMRADNVSHYTNSDCCRKSLLFTNIFAKIWRLLVGSFSSQASTPSNLSLHPC